MTAPEPLLIAVDGGGTGCRVAVGTRAQGVLGTARGGPANVSTSFDAAVANIMQTILEALAEANMGEVDLSLGVAHMGLAGADLTRVQDHTATMFPFGKTRVTGDRQTSVAGVLGEEDGFVVALGTGTIIARQQAGVIKTVSGWGFQLSDQASGAWLGRRLLSHTISAEEGIEAHSELTRRTLARMGDIPDIFDFSTRALPADYAAFAPDVFDAARKDDPFALELLREGADFIARGLTALDYTPGAALSLAGGVGPHYETYLPDRLTQNLRAPKGNALEGAFILARQMAD